MTDAARGLPRHAAFAAVLAAAGLPIYIHAPKFYVDGFGVTLAQLSVVLFLLRLIDVVQDPLLGRLAAITRTRRGTACWIAGAVMALSMLGLFAVPPLLPPVWWFALTLAGLFSGFSFLTICFYAQGVAKAAAMGDGHVRLAAWRETGSLAGVCLAAALPALLAGTGAPFAIYAAAFAVLVAAALWAMRPEWTARGPVPAGGLRAVLADPTARRLLLIALANATPVAVTSTLFLFFVEDRLAAPEAAGRCSSCSSFRPPPPRRSGAGRRAATARAGRSWRAWRSPWRPSDGPRRWARATSRPSRRSAWPPAPPWART